MKTHSDCTALYEATTKPNKVSVCLVCRDASIEGHKAELSATQHQLAAVTQQTEGQQAFCTAQTAALQTAEASVSQLQVDLFNLALASLEIGMPDGAHAFCAGHNECGHKCMSNCACKM